MTDYQTSDNQADPTNVRSGLTEKLIVSRTAIQLTDQERVLRPGGACLASVSCRKCRKNDQHEDVLHRTVKSVDWWIEKIQPDPVEIEVDA
jgi:hypothetical protein